MRPSSRHGQGGADYPRAKEVGTSLVPVTEALQTSKECCGQFVL